MTVRHPARVPVVISGACLHRDMRLLVKKDQTILEFMALVRSKGIMNHTSSGHAHMLMINDTLPSNSKTLADVASRLLADVLKMVLVEEKAYG
jgi:hypothetical protein